MLDRRLTHVVAVANASSFSKAADIVGITQSGITRSIADLERELGYALFHRTARGVTATERGRDFVERARQLIEDTRALMSGGEESDPYARSLRIGVAPSSLEWRLAEPLAALVARYPSIRFEVSGSGVERCVHLLRSGAVDVAVGFENAFADWSDLKLDRIGGIQPALYVRRGHKILEKDRITRADLAQLDCVMPSDSRPFGTIIRTLFETHGISWQRHLHVTDHQMIARRVVAKSDAFGFTSRDVTTSEGFTDQFASIEVEGFLDKFFICCATRARWELSKPVLAFVRIMRSVSAGGYDPGA